MLLVGEIFGVHEMRSQLEVTEMLEYKPYCAAPSFQRNTAAQKLWSVCMEMGHGIMMQLRDQLCRQCIVTLVSSVMVLSDVAVVLSYSYPY